MRQSRTTCHRAKVRSAAAPSAAVTVAMLLAVHTLADASPIPSQCFAQASERFRLTSPDVLRAIAQQESSGRCIARHPANADGSYDIGCMGINSSWLPTLQKKFGLSEKDLYAPCINVHVGAWIFAKNVRQYGDSWQALGAYNAKSEYKRIEYAWKIYKHLSPAR